MLRPIFSFKFTFFSLLELYQASQMAEKKVLPLLTWRDPHPHHSGFFSNIGQLLVHDPLSLLRWNITNKPSPRHYISTQKQNFAFSLQLLLQVEIVFLNKENGFHSLPRSRQCTDNNPGRSYCETEEEEGCRTVSRSAVRAMNKGSTPFKPAGTLETQGCCLE